MIQHQDLTDEEQERVRAALRYFRARYGRWDLVAKALPYKRQTIKNVVCEADAASARLLLRVAKLAGVSVDDVLSGRFPPPNVCPHCGNSVVLAEARAVKS